MSTQINDVEDFIVEIAKRWPPSHAWSNERQAAWGADLGDQLGSEKPEVLRQALRLMIGARSYTTTPPVADVMKAVNQAVREIGAQRRAGMLHLGAAETYDDMKPQDRPWTRERKRLAYELIQTETGRRAAREGWISPLWTFIIAHGRLPEEKEIDGPWYESPPGEPWRPRVGRPLKMAARYFDDTLHRLAASQTSLGKQYYAAAMRRVSDSQRLADIANGKKVPSRNDYYEQNYGKFDHKAKPTPASKYADENAAEGRGWKGRTA